MRRNEVLKYVQPFTEVGRNRCFDDRAVRFGHQTTHPRQLADLCRRAARTRIRHHVNRVEGFLLDLFALIIDDLFTTQLLHHHLGNTIPGLPPDVDHLVVALSISDQAVGVLPFDLLHLLLGRCNDFVFLGRYEHVVRADRNSSTGRQTISVLHQLIGKNYRLFEAAAPKSSIDQLRNFLLFKRFVEHTEWQAFGQNFREQGTPSRRLVTGQLFLPITIGVFLILFDAYRNPCMQIQYTRLKRTRHLGEVDKSHSFTFGIDTFARGIVQAQHDILRRHNDRIAVRRRQHIV